MTAPNLTHISAEDAEQEPNNVRMFPSNTPQPQFPRRSYVISAMSMAGFPVTITLNDMKLDQLDDALTTLLDRGYMPAEAPSVLPSPNAPAPLSSAQQYTEDNPPSCPYHGKMKPSKKPGAFYCPKKMGDGESYCKETWPKQ